MGDPQFTATSRAESAQQERESRRLDDERERAERREADQASREGRREADRDSRKDLRDFARQAMDDKSALKRAEAAAPRAQAPRVDSSFSAMPMASYRPPPEKKPRRGSENIDEGRTGRFTISLDAANKRLYVAEGTAAKTNPDELAEASRTKVVPGFPELGGIPLNEDPAPYFDVASVSAGVDYEVLWLDTGGAGTLYFKAETDPEPGEADSLVIGRMQFLTPVTNIRLDGLEQLWESDILWSELGSSSSSSVGSDEVSSSSEESSDVLSESSSQSESEKSSNAIVEMPWHPTKYGAMATVESNEVLFRFCLRNVPVKGRVTRVAVDPRFLFVCEKDSLTVTGMPVGEEPYPVGAKVRKNILTLTGYARADRRPKFVNLELVGVRRNFAGWDMPSRTAKQKAQSEAARRREYDR